MSKNTKIKDILEEFQIRIKQYNSGSKSKHELQQNLISYFSCAFGQLNINIQLKIVDFLQKINLDKLPYFCSDDFEKIKFLFVNRGKVYKILNIDDKE